jgi:hypothetical protein
MSKMETTKQKTVSGILLLTTINNKGTLHWKLKPTYRSDEPRDSKKAPPFHKKHETGRAAPNCQHTQLKWKQQNWKFVSDIPSLFFFNSQKSENWKW